MQERISRRDAEACTLKIACNTRKDCKKLQDILRPVLQPLDPEMNLVTIEDNNGNNPAGQTLLNSRCISRNLSETSGDSQGFVDTPSIAVVCFLRDDGPFSAEDVQKNFRKSPWKFHHKIELSNTRAGTNKCIAKQEFYQPGPNLPLWAVCPVHYGNEQLRFTIFTRNFSAMQEFYRILTEKEVEFTRRGFCYFDLYSDAGFDVQLALKESEQLRPYPLETSHLSFKLKSLKHVRPFLLRDPVKLKEQIHQIEDPDGNVILVEETHPEEDHQPNTNTTTKVFPWEIHYSPPGSAGSVKKRHWSDRSSYGSRDSGRYSFSLNSTSESLTSDLETFLVEERQSSSVLLDSSRRTSSSQKSRSPTRRKKSPKDYRYMD